MGGLLPSGPCASPTDTALPVDALVDSWRTRRQLSEHVRLEIGHAAHSGHRPGDPPPLGPGEPVPGCSCPTCTGIPADDPARVKPRRTSRDDRPLPVDAAKSVPILEIAERLGLELRPVGASHRGPCPIHGGTKPSFAAWPHTDSWHCFSCGLSGDGIELWKRIRGLTFAGAVLEIAGNTKRGGI